MRKGPGSGPCSCWKPRAQPRTTPSKALCDPAGAILDGIVRLPSSRGTMLRPSLRRGEASDHSEELRLVETADGALVAHDGWLAEHLPPLEPEQRVITVQAWSAQPTNAPASLVTWEVAWRPST